MSADTCPVQVWRGGDWNGSKVPCGKPAKRAGMCGVHANSAARRTAEADARREAADKRDAAKRIASELIEATAIPFGHNYAAEITLSLAAAENLLRTYFGRTS